MGASILTRIEEFLTGVRHNTTTEEVRGSYIESFDRAESSVYAMTGEIEADIFADQGVIASIRDAVNRDDHSVTVTIATGPAPHAESVQALLEFVPQPNFDLVRVNDRPDRHPLVVDERHVRISEAHPPHRPHAGHEHRATLIDDEPTFARRIARDIRAMTKHASVLSVSEWEAYIAESQQAQS